MLAISCGRAGAAVRRQRPAQSPSNTLPDHPNTRVVYFPPAVLRRTLQSDPREVAP